MIFIVPLYIFQKEESKTYCWKTLENEVAKFIPVFLKNILELNNLANSLGLRNIDDKMVKNLKIFVRDSMNFSVDPDKNITEFYRAFYKNAKEFKFVIGYILMLKNLQVLQKVSPYRFSKFLMS